MTRNRVDLNDLRNLPIGSLAELPGDQLALLQQEVEQALQDAKRRKEWLDGVLALRYGERASALRRNQGKDSGTVRFDDGPVTVVAELPKKITWDQARLAELHERIRAGGEDPQDYLEVTYKVSERRYAAWPANIRTPFEPARTAGSGKPQFRLTLKMEEPQ